MHLTRSFRHARSAVAWMAGLLGWLLAVPWAMPAATAGAEPGPAVSDRHPISKPAWGPAYGNQIRPALASSGDGFLVAYYDRNLVRATRLGPDGAVVDRLGFTVGVIGGIADPHPIDVAWNGSAYLVVWTTNTDVVGARVSPEGKVLDPEAIPIAAASGWQIAPAATSDGHEFLVAWQDDRNAQTGLHDIYAARVGGDGQVLDPVGIPVATGNPAELAPAVGWNGSMYLVGWSVKQDVFESDAMAARVTTEGTVLDEGGFLVSGAPDRQTSPSIASDGTGFFLTWADYRGHQGHLGADVYGARVDAGGHVLDPDGLLLSGRQGAPVVDWNGSNYLVVWADFTGPVTGALVSSAGEVVDGHVPITGTTQAADLDVAAAGDGGWVTTWEDRYLDDVVAARLSATGDVLEPGSFVVTTSADFQQGGAIAWNGSTYLAGWQRDQEDGLPLLAGRLDPDGVPLDGVGFRFNGYFSEQAVPPALSWNGESFLAVWSDSFSLLGNRVDGDGGVLDGEGFVIARGPSLQHNPAVAWDGANWLVAWEDRATGQRHINAARVGPDGTVLDTEPIPIAAADFPQTDPDVAWNGQQFLVVWKDERPGRDSEISGVRVSTEGLVLDTAPIAITSDRADQVTPAVASNGSEWMVVWGDRGSGANLDVFGSRIAQDGAVLDPRGIPIAVGSQEQRLPDVAWDGRSSVVVWEAGETIRGARVTASGAVLDPTGFTIAGEGAGESLPAVAAGPPGRVAVVYESFAMNRYGVSRVFLRFVDEPPAEAPPAAAAG
jgi:hypothetical protein